MTDLERQVRELLEDEARSAPAPHEATRALRKTGRRQGATIVTGLLAGTALVAASIVGLRTIRTADRGVPADQPTVTTTINGISITHPERWVVVDPEDAGLNGPEPTPDLPRLVLAVSPVDPGDAWGCPGLSQGSAPTFLMTVQDEPLALTGPDAAPWPVELQPMNVDAAEGGCYPGWEFLRAGWSQAGRTFEARVGLSPHVSDAEREALLTAFASMTFEPVGDGPASVVLATGTAGGEGWQLIASRGTDGLELMLQGESSGNGMGGFDPTPNELQSSSIVIGEGGERERVIFGAVPAEAVRVGVWVVIDDEGLFPVLDVPDTIDARLNAFVVSVADVERSVRLVAYGAEGDVVVSGSAGPSDDPDETSMPIITVTARDIALDVETIALTAGQQTTLTFVNDDAAVMHNLAIYLSAEKVRDAALFRGEIFAGVDRRDYVIPALEAGVYYFQCDVHPGSINGTVIVE